ncbi:MAG: hypothetical protein IPK46_21755 [Saprospiraceae bacterium]|nr:hypothetical protein [Saprospiraceae bacterium]
MRIAQDLHDGLGGCLLR